MTEALLVYLITGAVAGLLAGLFGIGGGMIIVPALAWLLPRHGHNDQVMQVAVGTSLACIAVTAISSSWAHHRQQGVLWPVFKQLVPGLVIGALIGAVLADMLPSLTLRRIVGLAALLVAVKMLLNLKPPATHQLPGTPGMYTAGSIIGSISSLIGIGGGSLTVPFLNWCNVPMKTSVGTSAACGVPIAWAGVLGFIVVGWDSSNLAEARLGHVYLPAFAGLITASVLCAPVGAKLAHSLPTVLLKRLFAILLAIIGINMLWF